MTSTPYVLIALIIPVMMLIYGTIFTNHPPKNRQALFGFRTPRSMKSQKNWLMAQKEMGKLWTRIGLVEIILVFMLELFFTKTGDPVLIVYGSLGLMVVQVIPLISSYIIIERKLKNADNKE